MKRVNVMTSCARGFSLVEMAIALSLLGVATATVLPLYDSVMQDQAEEVTQEILGRTRQSLVSFATRQGRLPCPAVEGGNGREVCDGRTQGRLPFVTLGLLDPEYQFVDYALPLPAAAQQQPQATYEVLRPSGTPERHKAHNVQRVKLAEEIAGRPGHSMLDLCAMTQTGTEPGQAFARFSFRTEGEAQDLGTTAAEALTSAELWSGMSCASFASVDGRSRFNLALSASVAWRSLLDLEAESKTEVPLLELDVVMGALDILAAQVTIGNSAARQSNSIAHNINFKGLFSYEMVMAVAPLALAGGSLLTSIANETRYATNLADVKGWSMDLTKELGPAMALEPELVERARQSNQDSLLLWRQPS